MLKDEIAALRKSIMKMQLRRIPPCYPDYFSSYTAYRVQGPFLYDKKMKFIDLYLRMRFVQYTWTHWTESSQR
jgi:hypothetical protein